MIQALIHRAAQLSLLWMIVGTLVLLSIVQSMVAPDTYTTFSVGAIFAAFAFKSWVNFVCAYTMYRQHGTSALARSVHRYFWAMLAQSAALGILFSLAFADRLGIATPFVTTEVRNTMRNLAIASVVAVIIAGSRMLEALFAYLRSQLPRDAP